VAPADQAVAQGVFDNRLTLGKRTRSRWRGALPRVAERWLKRSVGRTGSATSGDYVVIGYKHWLGQKYLLDRMTLGDLVKAYFTYPAIQVYLLLFALNVGVAVYLMEEPLPLMVAALLCFLVYPLVEYLLHRFLLHGRWLYRSPRTAALWKRIHYDHHQNPHELSVLFGALHTTLPIIVLVTAPIGWLAAGLPGIFAGLAAGFVIICFYEYGHCIQHLSY
jgi:hypothetical protein